MTFPSHRLMQLGTAVRAMVWLCALASTPLLAQSLPPPGLSAVTAAGNASGSSTGDALPLSLAQAERMMLERNRELQLAGRAREGARADSLMAAQPPNPTLSLQTASINPKTGTGSGSLRDKTVDSTVRIDQLIERGGKLELRVQTARTLENASDADYADALRQQRLALRSAYYDLLLAQEKSRILSDTAGLFARSMDAAEKRLAAGDIAGADLARMRVDALRAANEARMAEAERARAQAALAYLIGAERSSRQLQAGDRFPEPGVIATLDPSLIDARPDVRAAEARVKAAESARELARSLRTRDVSVGVQFEHFPSGPNDGASNSYGVGVSIPLFLRHSYEGELRRAEVDLSVMRDNLERVRALARGEMERAWSELQSASERVTRHDSGLLQEARRAAEAAEFAYRNGALGVMDLLDARRTLRATQIDAAMARADHARALAAWQAGIPSTPSSAMPPATSLRSEESAR